MAETFLQDCSGSNNGHLLSESAEPAAGIESLGVLDINIFKN